MPNRFATIKVSAQFSRWLKSESARRGVTMGALLEQLTESGLGGAPWERLFAPARPARRTSRRKHR